MIAGGLVTAIWVVADDLGLLRQLDAARLNGLRGTRQRRGPPHRLSDAVLPPDCASDTIGSCPTH
jgi:hypothetical protein